MVKEEAEVRLMRQATDAHLLILPSDIDNFYCGLSDPQIRYTLCIRVYLILTSDISFTKFPFFVGIFLPLEFVR